MRCPIHVIWTTYMTWLPGDERGHWSALFDLYGHLKETRHKLNLPDDVPRERAEQLAKNPPRILDEDERVVVATTIGQMLKTKLEPDARIHAATVDRTHVHLLFGPLEENIQKVVGRLKGSTSSVLLARSRELTRQRTWTAGYWKVFLFDDLAVATVARYIEQHNERMGLPSVPYDWITPVR